MNVHDLVVEAEGRIRPFIRQTILDHSPYYSQQTGANVYFKCENLQHTGSFKTRGAMNKLLSLSEAEKARGIVTASTGNHGAATAFSLRQVGAKGIIFVPETAEPAKVKNIERLGAEVRYHGQDGVETEMFARQFGAEQGMTFFSPYNDPQIMGGQGTIGVELERQLEQIDAVFVALGGGGLLGGIAGYLKASQPHVQIIGCSPANSQVMIQSVQAGEILDLPSQPTLSDGTAGGVEAGSVTFPACRDFVDDFVTVAEDEIANSLREFMGAQHMMIEGAAAVPIAAFHQREAEFQGKNVVIVLCGANIGLGALKGIL